MGIENVNSKNGVNIFLGDMNKNQRNKNIHSEKEQQLKNGSLYVGNINEKSDSVLTRKILAQKESIRVIINQFKSDLETDSDKQQIRDRKEDLSKLILETQDGIDKIDEAQENLKKNYEIDDNSEEQKNLELIRKSKREELTDGEKEQLKNMGPLTDYQKNSLICDDARKVLQSVKESAENEKTCSSKTLESIELELLKIEPMLKQQETAEKIMKVASAEIKGMLINESKEHVDDNLEENKEEAEKIQEEAEKIQEDVNLNHNVDSNIEAEKEIIEYSSGEPKLDKELKKIISANQILEEDLKGIEVDELL